VNTNYRHLVSFLTQLELFKNNNGRERSEWKTMKGSGQEKDKHRVINLINVGFLKFETECYLFTNKGYTAQDLIDADLAKERTLYDIYAENGNWPGNINLLLTNLNRDADNRGLPEELGEIRSNCRQRCMMNGACHFCETAFNFEKTIRNYKYERDKEKLEN
jgi:hypothetical protein